MNDGNPFNYLLVLVISYGLWKYGLGRVLKFLFTDHEKKGEKTFEKYKNDNPECVKRNRIICNDCGGDRIFVKSHNESSTWQKHICTQCGKTLYFSTIRV